ncbi:large-conductance mechanosensitive channel [Acrasis kona]|uniref:Large-conductance mechanosensitive channel n=1 Tax=Acrasis kona TaxID=1008807 RepID=A0AAW2ZLA3_9EUKA
MTSWCLSVLLLLYFTSVQILCEEHLVLSINNKEPKYFKLDLLPNNKTFIYAILTEPWYTFEISEVNNLHTFNQGDDLRSLSLEIEPQSLPRTLTFKAIYNNYSGMKEINNAKMNFNIKHSQVAVQNLEANFANVLKQSEQYLYYSIRVLGSYKVTVSCDSDVEVITSLDEFPSYNHKSTIGKKVEISDIVRSPSSVIVAIRKSSFCVNCGNVELYVYTSDYRNESTILLIVTGSVVLFLLIVFGLSVLISIIRVYQKKKIEEKDPSSPLIPNVNRTYNTIIINKIR